MITETHGNLLAADAEALVNTVNTEGVMGKGIALQFKRAFPDMFRDYARAAKAGDLRLGRMHVWATDAMEGPRFVINFPTKGHWRSRSRLADIDAGLSDLVRVVRDLEIRSIALPPLGCGNGGLEWADVLPRIRAAFAELPQVEVRVYPPAGTPPAASMPVGTVTPAMTLPRAAVVHLLRRYEPHAVQVSPIEVQKLAYFLQVAGEPLKLDYVKHVYGPYADGLRHALAGMEGHFVVGFGDGTAGPRAAEPIRLLPGADDRAQAVLASAPLTRERIARVLELSAGFESMYGMELLGSVHWVVSREDPGAVGDPEAVTRIVRSWTRRKADLFTERHVTAALHALRGRGWLTHQA